MPPPGTGYQEPAHFRRAREARERAALAETKAAAARAAADARAFLGELASLRLELAMLKLTVKARRARHRFRSCRRQALAKSRNGSYTLPLLAHWGATMPMTIRFVAAIFIAASFVQAPGAYAQTQQQLNWCNGKDGATPDLRISGCAAAIQSGKFKGADLAVAFYNRGIGYNRKGQYDRAIQDYDRAIKLNPRYVKAFVNRGNAYYRKGQTDRAIRDYDQAIKLDPNDAIAIENRAEAIAKKNK